MADYGDIAFTASVAQEQSRHGSRALGVGYNVFLIARTREDVRRGVDTRRAVLDALAVTGGVITSARIVLAAVFAVLGVLPLITLSQIGVIVGIGVLLDTLLVRTILVPALVILTGSRFWWPQRTNRTPPAVQMRVARTTLTAPFDVPGHPRMRMRGKPPARTGLGRPDSRPDAAR